jgi:uncharacterized protein YfcZ (UPF0381/DUF406 family)
MSCDAGFHLWRTPRYTFCDVDVCLCTNGVAKSGHGVDKCPSNRAVACASCDVGYELKSEGCLAIFVVEPVVLDGAAEAEAKLKVVAALAAAAQAPQGTQIANIESNIALQTTQAEIEGDPAFAENFEAAMTSSVGAPVIYIGVRAVRRRLQADGAGVVVDFKIAAPSTVAAEVASLVATQAASGAPVAVLVGGNTLQGEPKGVSGVFIAPPTLTYSWEVQPVAFEPCPSGCGELPWIQSRAVLCAGSDGRLEADERCGDPKPAATLACAGTAACAGAVDCAGSWGEFGPCLPDSASGDACSGTRARIFVASTAPAGGGQACPRGDPQACTVACGGGANIPKVTSRVVGSVAPKLLPWAIATAMGLIVLG